MKYLNWCKHQRGLIKQYNHGKKKIFKKLNHWCDNGSGSTGSMQKNKLNSGRDTDNASSKAVYQNPQELCDKYLRNQIHKK